MNTARVAVLLRELAAAIEEEEKPRAKRAKLPDSPPPPDELTMARAKQILKRKGIQR